MEQHTVGIDPPLPSHRHAVANSSGGAQSYAALILGAILLLCLFQAIGSAWFSAVFQYTHIVRISDCGVLLLAWLLSIVIHESGHLMAALACRFRLLAVTVGPVRFSCGEKLWTARLSNRSWFAASISAIPTRRMDWRGSMLLVVAAGPFATLCATIAPVFVLGAGLGGPTLKCWLAYLAEINLILFVLGLVPNGSRARVRNDASLFSAILWNTPAARDVLLYHLITQVKLQGFRPCFYPEELIRLIAKADSPPEMLVVFALMISDWALDRGDLGSASAWDWRASDLIADCSEQYRALALAHASYMDVLVRNSFLLAESRCCDLPFDVLKPEWLRHRTLAIARLAGGNIMEGMAELQRSEHTLPAGTPYAEFERNSLRNLRQKAKALSMIDHPLNVQTQAGQLPRA